MAAFVLILYYASLWDLSFLKDTIIWSLASATVLLFNLTKAKEINYFWPLVLENLKVSVILEFVLNFYTFDFFIELFFIPSMAFLVILKTHAEHSAQSNPEHSKVANCLSKLLSFIGLGLIVIMIYKTFTDISSLATESNLISIILPFVFTLCILPYLYFATLAMAYEQIFIRIPFLITNDKKRRKLKKLVFFNANINLNRLNKISSNLYKISDKSKLKKVIKKLLR